MVLEVNVGLPSCVCVCVKSLKSSGLNTHPCGVPVLRMSVEEVSLPIPPAYKEKVELAVLNESTNWI